MFRPSRTFCTASLLALSLLISGCGTMYTSMYSPRRSYYERPPEAVAPSGSEFLPPVQGSAPGTAPANIPGSPTGPAAPPPPALDLNPGLPGMPM